MWGSTFPLEGLRVVSWLHGRDVLVMPFLGLSCRWAAPLRAPTGTDGHQGPGAGTWGGGSAQIRKCSQLRPPGSTEVPHFVCHQAWDIKIVLLTTACIAFIVRGQKSINKKNFKSEHKSYKNIFHGEALRRKIGIATHGDDSGADSESADTAAGHSLPAHLVPPLTCDLTQGSCHLCPRGQCSFSFGVRCSLLGLCFVCMCF